MRIKLKPGEVIMIVSEGGKIKQSMKVFIQSDGVIGCKRSFPNEEIA